MTVTLNELTNVQNSGSYYLSDNGTIKQAGLWTKFKYALNLGHSRERAANLVNVIRDALVKAGARNDFRLNNQLGELDTNFGLKGSSIRELLSSFQATQGDRINCASARRTAVSMINQTISELAQNPRFVKSSELKDLFLTSCKNIIEQPPLKNEDGRDQVDTEALRNALTNNINNFKTELEK